MYNASEMVNKKPGRILAVDWGLKRIGLAVSDPTQTIAYPLDVIRHTSRSEDAEHIKKIALEKNATRIIMGAMKDEENRLSPSGRSAERLAEEIRRLAEIPVSLFPEDETTISARKEALKMGLPRKKRRGHLDSLAASIILQNYLDNISSEK